MAMSVRRAITCLPLPLAADGRRSRRASRPRGPGVEVTLDVPDVPRRAYDPEHSMTPAPAWLCRAVGSRPVADVASGAERVCRRPAMRRTR